MSDEPYIRPRINFIFKKAIGKKLIVVCAGMGCGKTHAISDFTKKSKMPVIWLQLSKYDNIIAHFWENFISMALQLNISFAEKLKSLGFPDNDDKLNQYFMICENLIKTLHCSKYLIILDNFHLINNFILCDFINRLIHESSKNSSIILSGREFPKFNITELINKGEVYFIRENELNFTENELSIYLAKQGISLGPELLHEITQDVNGWTLTLNFIEGSLKTSPGYDGYTRNATRNYIFGLMEVETWSVISDQLKRFLIRISIVKHYSVEFIEILSGQNNSLTDELRQQNAYIRYDMRMNAYYINPLFLEFLHTKQTLLTPDEKFTTYQAAADWCRQNNYIVDSLCYYKKIDDYETIVSIFFELPFFLSYDLALYIVKIFRKIPEENFCQADYLAAMYLRILISLNLEKDFNDLAQHFEKVFSDLPEDNLIRRHSLGLIWLCRGIMQYLTNTEEIGCDLSIPFEKMNEFLFDSPPVIKNKWLIMNHGPWISTLHSAEQGAPQKYLDAAKKAAGYINQCFGHITAGQMDLVQGELRFYQGDIQSAESLITTALEAANESGLYDTTHRALFYLMRIAFCNGNRQQAERTLKKIEALRDIKEYPQRYITCDIALGWYYYILRQPNEIPAWLKDIFSPYGHIFSLENFGNQIKARFQYLTKNYTPLLTFINETKSRNPTLFGRIEMLTIEACVHYKLKRREKAFVLLQEAYEIASPNEILMPFIELGKDMRSLTSSALHETNCSLPQSWLKLINRKASIYAKHQANIISDYEKNSGIDSIKELSPRESEILHDLCKGLSRYEISVNLGLSINTIKMNISNIFSKINAVNTADAIRIATEQKIT